MTSAQLNELQKKRPGLVVKENGKPISQDKPKKSKYRNRKVVIDGIEFHSIKEGKRYLELQLWVKAGVISDLKRQVEYLLIEGNDTEQPTRYFADFTYIQDGLLVVEDVKSVITRKKPDYIIKLKLMLDRHGIRIKET